MLTIIPMMLIISILNSDNLENLSFDDSFHSVKDVEEKNLVFAYDMKPHRKGFRNFNSVVALSLLCSVYGLYCLRANLEKPFLSTLCPYNNECLLLQNP